MSFLEEKADLKNLLIIQDSTLYKMAKHHLLSRFNSLQPCLSFSLEFPLSSQMWSLEFYLSVGAPRHKIVVGIATYGMSFTLANREQHGMKAPVTGGGRPGPYTRENGILAYYEVNLCRTWHTYLSCGEFKLWFNCLFGGFAP